MAKPDTITKRTHKNYKEPARTGENKDKPQLQTGWTIWGKQRIWQRVKETGSLNTEEGDWWMRAAEDKWTQVKGEELTTRQEGTDEKVEEMAKLRPDMKNTKYADRDRCILFIIWWQENKTAVNFFWCQSVSLQTLGLVTAGKTQVQLHQWDYQWICSISMFQYLPGSQHVSVGL